MNIYFLQYFRANECVKNMVEALKKSNNRDTWILNNGTKMLI